MRSRVPQSRRFSVWILAALMLLVLILGIAGSVGVLAYSGVVDFAALFNKRKSNPYEGLVAVPISGTDIPAYASVSREHLLDYELRKPTRVLHLRPEDVAKSWILDYGQIMGRVMAHEKAAGYAFTESDFLPKGTRPGVVAGIPPGKLAMTLDASQVRGLKDLRIGDRFDLLSSSPFDVPSSPTSKNRKSELPAVAKSDAKSKATVNVLVTNGAIVTRPAAASAPGGPRPSTAMGKFTGGDAGAAKGAPKEMIIAVDAGEIGPLTEALSVKSSLFCVARSGHPDDKGDSQVAELKETEQTSSSVETMRGHKLDVEVFPGSQGAKGDEPDESNSRAANPRPAAGSMRSSEKRLGLASDR